MNHQRWRLPDGIDEVLPPEAARLETLRRELLDLYAAWGYELVIPPFIDYLDSLLTGTGHDLDLKTFKLTDQESGRLMGVRADMTPQVARIDAHRLRRDRPSRLCYMGTVLHTRSDGFAGTRAPLQIGAEIFGHDGVESDVEVLRLLVATLAAAGVEGAYVDLGHVGIFRALARQASLERAEEMLLFDALQRKAIPEIHDFIETSGMRAEVGDMLLALPELNGTDALERAGPALAAADDPVQVALERLRRVAQEASRWMPDLSMHFDLGELRGYAYKTGIVFAAFAPGWGKEVGRGGRYDDIGRVFGRSRPAVGFSTDLKGLLALGRAEPEGVPAARPVYVPWCSDPALGSVVERLRREGRQVIYRLPGDAGQQDEAGETLVRSGGEWVLQPSEED